MEKVFGPVFCQQADLRLRATSGPKRTWEQQPRIRRSRKKTGGGPAPPHYTLAEELALGLNVNRPIVEGIPGGTSSLDQNPGTSNTNTFITVHCNAIVFSSFVHNTPTLLPVPNKVVAKICADSEETLSDDCPLEEYLQKMTINGFY
ncbi:hypothetical protein cypCar_00040481 [Cyprinus carpio]|nr:hypothetical protein cypCar_00040481 [Cyprinus carpio]